MSLIFSNFFNFFPRSDVNLIQRIGLITLRGISISPQKIGLIGLGLVGTAFAERLLDQGYTVHGFDINPDRMLFFKSRGGIPEESVQNVAARSEIVILALMTAKIIESVISADCSGILAAEPLPKFVMNCSTIEPDASRKIHATLHHSQIGYLEAPISGSSLQIRNGQGTFLLGGETHIIASLQPVLDCLAKNQIHVGSIGDGCAAKLTVNLVLGLNRAVLAEGLIFAEMMGLPPQNALKILKRTAAYSSVMDVKGEKMITQDFTPAAYLFQHAKDVDLIIEQAWGHHRHLPFSELHAKLLRDAVDAGDGELDNAAIFKEIRRISFPP